MKKAIVIIIFIKVITIINNNTLNAQSHGGIAGEFLRWGVGGQAMGMGRAFVGKADDASAPYWNPAGLAYLDRIQTSLMSTYLFKGISHNYIGFVYPKVFFFLPSTFKDRFVFGANIIWLYAGGIERWEEAGNDFNHEKSEDFSWTETAALFSLGCRVFDWPTLELGVTGKVLHRSLLYTDYGGGLDFGIRVRPFTKPLFLGLQVQNICSPGLGEDKFPLVIRSGISWAFIFPWIKTKSLLNVDFDGIKGKSWKFWKPFDCKLGIECKINKFLFLRGGYSYRKNQKKQLMLGFGLTKLSGNIPFGLNFDCSAGFSDNELGFDKTFTPLSSITAVAKANIETLFEIAKTCQNKKKKKYYLHKIVDKAVDNHSVTEAYIQLGYLEYETGNFKSAINYFDSALKQITIKGLDINTSSLNSILKFCRTAIDYEQNIIKNRNKNEKKINKSILSYYKQAIIELLEKINNDISFNKSSEEFKNILTDFKDGIDFLESENYKKAREKLNKIIVSVDTLLLKYKSNSLYFPDSCLADDAQFLIGECYYLENKISKAIIEHSKMNIFYPDLDASKLSRLRIKDIVASGFSIEYEGGKFKVDTLPKLKLKKVKPFNLDLNYPSQIVKDSIGYFYIVDSKNKVIKKYNRDMGGLTVIKKNLLFPISIAIDYKDNKNQLNKNIYIADCRQNKIIQYSDKKTILPNIEEAKAGFKENHSLFKPIGLAILNKHLYVTDAGNNRILRFEIIQKPIEDSLKIYSSITKNKLLKDINCPTSIAIDDKEGKLLFVDYGNKRVCLCKFYDDTNTIILEKFLENPNEKNKIWIPLSVFISHEKQTFIYMVYHQLTNNNSSLIIKYDSTGIQRNRMEFDLCIFSIFIDNSNDKLELYLIERSKNGRIIKYYIN